MSYPLPVGKNEFYDGVDWYSLASENWVLNNSYYLAPCAAASTISIAGNYNNFTNGVGATLTGMSNTAFNIDGSNMSLGNRVLLKNQGLSYINGIYIVTTVGSSSAPWVITRAPDFDSSNLMTTGKAVNISGGATNGATSWMLIQQVNNVGSDPVIFNKIGGSTGGGISGVNGTNNQIGVTTSSGTATVFLANNPIIPGTASVTLPSGTTIQRPASPTAGMLRWNTSP